MEPDIAASANVAFHPEARQRDSFDWSSGVELLQQIDPRAIRQTDVAHEHIKLFVRRVVQRGMKSRRRLDVIAAAAQEICE